MKKIVIIFIICVAMLIACLTFGQFKEDGKKELFFSYNRDLEIKDDESIMLNDSIPNSEVVDNDDEKEELKEGEKRADEKADGDSSKNSLKIKNRLVTWGYEKSKDRSIDTIVVHSSYNALGGGEYDLDKLIAEYKNYGVSPHYLIDREGNMYRLVDDSNIAYHAGESKVPDGRTGVNNFSLGIEIINSKSDQTTIAQYSSLKYLVAYIKGKHTIKYVLGHSDIAKGRKDDPWNFEWSKMK